MYEMSTFESGQGLKNIFYLNVLQSNKYNIFILDIME